MEVLFLFWVSLLTWLPAARLVVSSSQQLIIDPEVVLAPSFRPVTPLNTSDQSPESLISALEIAVYRDTSVVIQWNFDGNSVGSGFPLSFEIEQAEGDINQDFLLIDSIGADSSVALPDGKYQAMYTINNLRPLTVYRVRIAPVFKSGNGFVSSPLTFTTVSAPTNYWEPLIPRRSSEVSQFRGLSNPVLTRPHLSEGVEIFGERTHSTPFGFANDTLEDTALWYSDPPTSEARELPSGRRGSSLTLIEGTVYMFGGRTNGYSCASVLKDTINLGLSNSGIDIYPCVSFQAEVNEIWSFDISSYTWKYLNTSKYQDAMPPSPREQHSAGEIAGNLFIFGGKSRFHPSSHDGSPLMTNASDEVYGDLWELQLEHPTDFAYELPVEQQGSIISQEAPTLLKINATMAAVPPLTYVTPRDGYCVKDLTVKVVFEHPCITQVRMSLFGPGPLTGSPNFFPPADGLEVLLLSNVATNSTYCVGGKHSFVFNDNFERDPSSCCSTKFSGPYRPAGKLSEFIDTTMLAEWILSIQDLSQDGLVGKVHSFEMDFVSAPCFPSYTWTNLTQSMTGDLPTPRYDSYMITYRESLFIYGGRDALDRTLHDLYRYDVSSHHWTMLTPTNFQVPLLSSPTTLFGSSLALTSWGIFQFGGYARLPTLTISSQSPRGGIYTHDVTLLDLITMRWSDVQVDHGDQQDILFGGHTIPHERYLASLVFLPASTFRWRNAQSERLLYDAPKRSYHSNFQGPVADSLLLFGGFDGAIGAAVDGSLGGYFNDLWMLRLNTLSTSESHQKQRQYLQKHCSWRQSAGAQRAGATSCLSATTGERCDMRDLLLLPWCAGRNQTLSA